MNKKQIILISSAIIWIIGLVLAFLIPPTSQFIWLPDALLLLGFFPLLIGWRPSWPWIVFGVLNICIGFVLLVSQYLPDTSLPKEMMIVRRHLLNYHVPMVWMLIGAIATVYGTIRMFVNMLIWGFKRLKK